MAGVEQADSEIPVRVAGGLEVWDRRGGGKAAARSPLAWGAAGCAAADAADIDTHIAQVIIGTVSGGAGVLSKRCDTLLGAIAVSKCNC